MSWLWRSRVSTAIVQLCPGSAGKRFILGSKFIEGLFVKLFKIEERVVRTLGRAYEFVKFHLDCLGVSILCVLNEKHHEEGDYRRAGIDDQLPRVAEAEHWASNDPHCNDGHGEGKYSWLTTEVRCLFRESRVPRNFLHTDSRFLAPTFKITGAARLYRAASGALQGWAPRLQCRDEFVWRYVGLTQDTCQRAHFDFAVHGDDTAFRTTTHDDVAPGLPKLLESQTLQRSNYSST